MSGKIYLIQSDERLQELTEQPYDTEKLLQTLLEKYHNLLAGDQMNSDSPRRWLLISREVNVPGEEASAGWLDHLFLDQDAIPTLVEVKRSSDTRIRREVVGQMLDYAANAVAYLPVEGLRARFEAACERRGDDPAQAIVEFVDAATYEDEGIEDAFWGRVKTNLQAGRIRMVFVADKIPPELKRIVEFLNQQMDPAEVLAVEIKQYVGQGLRTLVPRVIGQTAEAERKKGSSGPREAKQWDESSFFAELEARQGLASASIARKILDWAKVKMPDIYWGKGKRSGSFNPGLNHNGASHQVIGVWTSGVVELQFQYMKSHPPFDVEGKRLELLQKYSEAIGISLPEDYIHRRQSISLSQLEDAGVLQRFLTVLDWVVQEIKST
ncbi:MAG TPA: hypothetical protein VF707_09745 [Ardenticatenaceae bacterium]|jgi:hypothetical protein